MTSAGRIEDDDADRDALLQLLLADAGIDIGSGIGRRDRSQPAVLSAAQERMWFLEQFEDDTATLAIRAAIALYGPLDVSALRAGLDEIHRRHEVLRTIIRSDVGEPVPVVLPAGPMPFEERDAEGELEVVERILVEESGRTFDLGRDAPIAVTLVRVSDDHHVLSVVMHHAASDGSSFGVFFRELQALYGAFVEGRPSPLADLALQYDDYAAWQHGDASVLFDEQLAYWRDRLAGDRPHFAIPPDHQRPARHAFAGGKVVARLAPELSRDLAALGRSLGATLFMTMLAGFEIVVSRHADQDDVVIGTPVAGRVRPEFEPLIGAFLNTVVLRTDLGGAPTVSEAIERVRDESLAAFDHQDVPFELVLKDLQPRRDVSRTPLFQIFFNMTHHAVAESIALPGLRTEILGQPDQWSNFDLTMYVNDSNDGTELALVYDRSLYTHAHMEHLVDQYLQVLAEMVAAPERRIDELSLIAESDRAVLPDPTIALDATWQGSVPASLRRIAARSPERLAVVDGSQRWSYGVLATQMSQLASWLRLRGTGRGELVAIHAHRSGSLAWVMTGVLASGLAYLLLDADHPPKRLAQLLRVAKPTVWLSLDGAGPPPVEVVAALDDLGVGHRLDLPDVADPDELERVLGVSAADVAESDVDAAIDAIGPDDVACVTFTSGSTGTPKAVVGRHGSLTHFLPWMSSEFGVGEDDRFSVLSGLSHDPLQRDIFWPIWLGATLVVPDPDELHTAGYIGQWMRDQRITVAHLTPAMGRLIAERGADAREVSVESLRLALFIGESLTLQQVAQMHELAPGATVVNLYGTTETQRASGYHVVDDDAVVPVGVQPKQVIPLGTGMPGAQLVVVTSTGSPAAVGEVGEIVMRSPHLALGYLDDEQLTASRFRDDPNGSMANDRIYATGDRGRHRSDGSVEFLGRNDGQVQLRGFRIELGEVAAALRQDARVADAVAELLNLDAVEPRLVAYVVGESAGIDTVALLRSLRSTLPAYLVPSDIIELDRIPTTPNGKVDWRALPGLSIAGVEGHSGHTRRSSPDDSESNTGASEDAPGDSLEHLLMDIWQQVLGHKEVGVHDDFFALGGYSLLATRVFALIEARTGRHLPVSVLFEHPTIAELAVVIRDDGWTPSWSSLVPIQPAGAAQPFYYVSPFMISVLELAPLGDELGESRPLYGLQPRGLDGSVPPDTTIEAMAAHYIAEMKTVQPEGPYALGGHCSGSWVAFEMVRQLEAAGDEINAIALVDQGPPGVDAPRIRTLPYVLNRVRYYLGGRRLGRAMAWQFKILVARVLLRRVGSSAVRFAEEVRAAHRAAYQVYGGGRIQHDVLLVLSADSLSLTDKQWYTRWDELTDGTVTIRDVGGTHANLLVQPFVHSLAEQISSVLEPPTA